jgi:8-oxo-dGTP pyrophosphatase MutT (NUDIX family)
MTKTEPAETAKAPKNSWISEGEKTLLSSPIMDLIERRCHSSEDSERKFKFYLLKSNDWCNIIPITEDGKVVMVKQYRIGISGHTLEIPGGVIDSEDQNHQVAAIRELQEETGYAPLPEAKCVDLGWSFPNPAIMNNRCHSYAIGPVRRISDQNLDAGEMIEIVEVPISEIPDRIIRGEINHALMLITFFFLSLESQQTSNSLTEVLNRFTGPKHSA